MNDGCDDTRHDSSCREDILYTLSECLVVTIDVEESILMRGQPPFEVEFAF